MNHAPLRYTSTPSELSAEQEARRIAALRRYDILDTPPEGAFDRITAIAARTFSVPISIVSLVDEDRIWFKSHRGVDATQIDRAPGLCASAILQDEAWVLTNAATDARSLSNPLVASEFGLRFYAGVPLRTHDGHNLGTLCVIDRKPREISERDLANLQDLAGVVMDQMEVRLSARQTVADLLRMSAQHEVQTTLLIETERRLEAVLNNATVSVFLMDERQQCAYMNPAAERLTGYSLPETRGRPLHDVIHHTRPDGSHFPIDECAIDRAFPEDLHVTGEEVFVHKDGSFYPVAFTASPVRDAEARTIGTIIEVRDIREEKAREQQQLLLINELNHRVKNTLAIIQSVARQSLREPTTLPEARAKFEGRLAALASAHDVLTAKNWEAAPLWQIVTDALIAHLGDRERFTVDGPDLLMPPKSAVAIAMAVHELATNATKYGSLSVPHGRVAVTWSCMAESLNFIWREEGGPYVEPPSTRGFGSKMLEQALALELGGQVTLAYERRGLVCCVKAPIPSQSCERADQGLGDL